ncbi:MAG TPA: PVC-type heme-binding CxxCH protein [Pirellulales bacterium]|nr:PVC-type heme-binding CxxCH protein [Pirellulales bacterium]
MVVFVAAMLVTPDRAYGQGYPADEAPRHMTIAEGFEAQLVAAEPLVRQPVAIEFDDRGRLWVVQYLQYPNPAGLKRVQVDRYSRTVYDKMPEPPPRGTPGADRVTILEDTDGDGRADRAKDFVAGLNLASGLAFGYGGVFVMNAPYLLFYPDRDRDDVPDSDPEVLLTGFGIEDAHSVANSLTWGPDGWLYGAQGSTVTANVRGIEFQQGVWRYHPVSHKFELFCEGGGNSWGVDFDAHGELLYSTNFGGFVMLHGVQGGYYWKNFGKHGALHNPYTYGYFDHVPHANFTGGHVTDGGIVYQADLFPAEFRGRYIAADLLGHAVHWHTLALRGSSFSSAHGGTLLAANDTWFAPSDVTVGPDGAVYVADWHDARTAHPDPDAEWDRRNGRVYRIQPRGAVRKPTRDLRDVDDDALVSELAITNRWYVRRARRILAERAAKKRNPAVAAQLKKLATGEATPSAAQGAGVPPLEALWTLYCVGGFDETTATQLLQDTDPHLRAWTVRLIGDEPEFLTSPANRLVKLAGDEPSVIVRRQLASTAKRLPADTGISIAARLAEHAEDKDDPYLPLLIWWAVEHFATESRDAVLATFTSPQSWQSPLTRDFLLPRLIERYAAERNADGAACCEKLLSVAPNRAARTTLWSALDKGWRGRVTIAEAPATLVQLAIADWQADRDNMTLARLTARLGHRPARDYVLARALDADVDEASRVAAIDVLAELAAPRDIARLASLLTPTNSAALQAATLRALARASDPELADAVLAAYPQMTPNLRSQARDVLLAKRAWARRLLDRVAKGAIEPQEIPLDQLRVVAAHDDEELNALVRRFWGAIHQATPEERLAVVRRLNNDLRAAVGHADAGRDIFRRQCGTCHTLFGEGEKIGPELTHANRRDRDFLLASIVDPGAVVRKEYTNYTVQTTDGRILTGLLAEQDANSVTVLTAKNERLRLARSEVESINESPQSLMPDNIAEQLSPQNLRDLFAWLQSQPDAK